jgi:hypothetical protein
MLALSSASFSDTPPPRVVNPRADVENLLMKGGFDELESIAADYRSSQARMAGGFWALERVYEWTTTFSDTVCACDAAGGGGKFTFEQKRQAIELWLRAKPGSLTATIALAYLWQRYAWHGRGPGYADKTTNEQWAAFHDRAVQALGLLRSLDHKADPEIYLIEMELAPSADHARRKLDGLYAAATKTFPNFPDYAAVYSEFLLPRWYGAPGEAQAFIRSLLQTPGDRGIIAYFTAARGMIKYTPGYAKFYEISGTNYANLVKSFAVRKHLFGLSNNDENALLFFAVAAGDKKSAAMLVKDIGKYWSPKIWTSESNFVNARSWASSWL